MSCNTLKPTLRSHRRCVQLQDENVFIDPGRNICTKNSLRKTRKLIALSDRTNSPSVNHTTNFCDDLHVKTMPRKRKAAELVDENIRCVSEEFSLKRAVNSRRVLSERNVLADSDGDLSSDALTESKSGTATGIVPEVQVPEPADEKRAPCFDEVSTACSSQRTSSPLARLRTRGLKGRVNTDKTVLPHNVKDSKCASENTEETNDKVETRSASSARGRRMLPQKHDSGKDVLSTPRQQRLTRRAKPKNDNPGEGSEQTGVQRKKPASEMKEKNSISPDEFDTCKGKTKVLPNKVGKLETSEKSGNSVSTKKKEFVGCSDKNANTPKPEEMNPPQCPRRICKKVFEVEHSADQNVEGLSAHSCTSETSPVSKEMPVKNISAPPPSVVHFDRNSEVVQKKSQNTIEPPVKNISAAPPSVVHFDRNSEVVQKKSQNTIEPVPAIMFFGKKSTRSVRTDLVKSGNKSKKEVQFEAKETGSDVSGPVYKNARRSDIPSDADDLYAFPIDEDEEDPPKKRRRYKRNPSKKVPAGKKAVCMWDPKKKILPSARLSKKNTKGNGEAQDLLNKVHTGTAQSALNINIQKEIPVVAVAAVSTPELTETPVRPSPLRNTSYRNMLKTPYITNHHEVQGASPNSRHVLSSPFVSGKFGSPVMAESVKSVLSPQVSSQMSTPIPAQSSTPNRASLAPQVSVLPHASGASPQVSSQMSTPIPAQSSTPNRESFAPQVSVLSHASGASPIHLSTTLTGSVSHAHPGPISHCSEENDSKWGSDLNSHDESDLFHDIPVVNKVSLPARMFAARRGVSCTPRHDAFVTRRNLPQCSPEKVPVNPRPTTVKFSVIPENRQTSAEGASPVSHRHVVEPAIDNCFGFDDEVEAEVRVAPAASVPDRLIVRPGKRVGPPPTPKLSVEEVKAMLMGRKLSTAPSTPRGSESPLQCKSSTTIASTSQTPSAGPNESQATPITTPVTPTPVPLFGEDLSTDSALSPFLKPPRRSYERQRSAKRIVRGDTIYSDEEEEGEDDHSGVQKKKADQTTAPVAKEKKPNSTYSKKKKLVQTKLIDQWANKLTTHFEEIEDVELFVQ